jgi:hypothetical protein
LTREAEIMKIAADAGRHAQQEADPYGDAFPGKYLSVTRFGQTERRVLKGRADPPEPGRPSQR